MLLQLVSNVNLHEFTPHRDKFQKLFHAQFLTTEVVILRVRQMKVIGHLMHCRTGSLTWGESEQRRAIAR